MPGFSKNQRLLAKPQFDAVLNDGIKVVCRDFVLVASKTISNSAPARLGLIVSRKVGGSVQRNRVKRCVRESFRNLVPQSIQGRDLVVIARPSLTSEGGNRVALDIHESFEKCLQRLGNTLTKMPVHRGSD